MRIGAPDALRDKDPATAGHRPSHGRYKVLAMLFLLSIITYLDRVCIAAAAPLMTAELGMTPLQMGMVFSAFFWAYGIFEIPSGWMGDRYGPRKTLTRIVLWWSFFTALTGRVNGFYALWATRFLFGAGEAGAGTLQETGQFGKYRRCVAFSSRWLAGGQPDLTLRHRKAGD